MSDDEAIYIAAFLMTLTIVLAVLVLVGPENVVSWVYGI